MKDKIVPQEALQAILETYKNQNKKIVSTSGCFDLIHMGHILYLQEAAAYGDCLVVLLNTDESVKKIKGDQRPIVPQEERAYLLSSLEMIDFICLFEEETPCSIIQKIQPDFFIKGGDYRGIHIPEMDAVCSYGGRVEYVHLAEGYSTTDLIHKIIKIYN